MTYKPTIGLEIHTELKTKSKMFCNCVNNPFEKIPNLNICPICAGHPGTLPVANKKAIELVIKTAEALNCEIPKSSKFDRKNYFYPDLPKGYQISQYDEPLSKDGYLEIEVGDDGKKKPKDQKTKSKKIRIRRIHLEEDTGKLVHPETADYSLVDLNRAGAPLMELVTEPDIASGVEAKKFCQDLQLIFRYLDVSDADMEKGQMRCEVNISMSNNKKLGTKVEIKNLNSFKAVEKSIEYEIKRQTEVLEGGQKVVQETRGWDASSNKTFSQRAKEEAHDYRYFPEPDLPPLETSVFKTDIVIPELPQSKMARFAKEYQIPAKDVEIIVSDKNLADYFENATSELNSWAEAEKIDEKEVPKVFKLLANYFIRDLLKLMAEKNVVVKDIKITPENFAEFIVMVYEGKISSSAAQKVFDEMFISGKDPEHVIQEKDLGQVSDEASLDRAAQDVIAGNPKPVEDYKKGKVQALQFLTGQVMKATKGKANPKIVMDLLKKKLEVK